MIAIGAACMRADRLLSLLMLLEVHRKLTAQEMAQRLEVSERTIHRDMEALSASGVPVYAERGTGGGWSLQEGYHVKLNGLNQSEIRSLFLNSPSRLLTDLGLEQSSEMAYRKLTAALSPAMRQDAEFARERLHIDGAGWNHRDEEVPYLQLLQTAVWEQRKLVITYEKLSDASLQVPLSERSVHPLGLVAKGHAWYLVASTEEGQLRSYRISRVRSAALSDEPSLRPVVFDLEAFWELSKLELKRNVPKYMAQLLVESSVIPKLRRAAYIEIAYIGEPGSDFGCELDSTSGSATSSVSKLDSQQPLWLPVEVDFQTLNHACEFILSQGASIQVLLPNELRDHVAEQARRIIDLYD
jgi:predicted DNA-binding transcriptional regulator YafY